MIRAKLFKMTLLTALLFTLFSCEEYPKSIKLTSPNSRVELIVDISKQIHISQLLDGDSVITKSLLDLNIDGSRLLNNFTVNTVSTEMIDGSWEPVIGKKSVIDNSYSQILINGVGGTIEKPLEFNLTLRCYDEGVAYRYDIPTQSGIDSITIDSEESRINLCEDFRFWCYNGENHNIGPLTWSETPSKEYKIPFVSEVKDNLFIGIHEAEIIRYAPFSIEKREDESSIAFKVGQTRDRLPVKTSWRTFIVGNSAPDLVNSNLLVNLNEPCKIDDTSWIKGGRAVWDWRVWGYTTEDGYEYGLNTKSHFRFIDFAADNNIEYLLIDADWYGAEFDENSDPTKEREGIDIERCMAYAKERGVGVILYLNDVGAKKFGLERVLKQFADWGASGVKYGFMRGSMEQKVRHTRRVVELCAKNHLMVNFHDGPVPPSGDDRTWPNLITKEFCHSQSDALRSYFPETIVTTTFVNMMAGAIDNCDGWFDFEKSFGERVKVFENIPGTVAAEVAKLVVIYSGMNIMPDAPEEYLKKRDLFECIKSMPSQFDNFKVVSGVIGEHIVVSRRAGDDLFIAALTNREGRVVNITPEMVDLSGEYTATIYEDAKTTHFLNERESYNIREIAWDGTENIELNLAEGGGATIHFHISQK